VRQIDTVARFGGDEFVVLLEDLTSDREQAHSQADLVAGKIRSLLADPYVLQTVTEEFGVPQTIEHKCTASIGVALFLGQNNTGEEVLKWADLAMYNAKDAGRNTVCFCDAHMWSENTTRQILEEDLHDAVLNKQFCVYFQAQFDQHNQVIGADALLRWQHPSRGWVSPREFIPKAERTGLILPMGLWVLESACIQLALWAKRAETADLTVTVNVSGRQLVQRDFVEQVMDTLARTGAEPQRLKLEMKESVLIADVESVIAKISALKAKGIGISLDDFGKGYSSLSSLNRLPLDQIKIDQDFVRDILIDPDDAAVAKMVVALADSMEVAVIAEGVETQAQRDFLASLGCHKYQGHLLSPALPVHEFEELLARLRA
jgi:EAL domain-containing protein (putative c-di-GMP-specific phosphodiesterase class I)